MSVGIWVDLSGAMAETIGPSGITLAEMDALADRFDLAVGTAQRMRKRGAVGFWDLPYRKKLFQQVDTLVHTLADFDEIIFLGVGGGIAGCRAMAQGMAGSARIKERKRFHFPNTIEPDALAELAAQISPKKTAIVLVCKSGCSPEAIAALAWFRHLIEQAVGKKKVGRHFIVSTDMDRGCLRDLAVEMGAALVPFPDDVGGRFAGLTAVGLLPVAASGGAVDPILKAAMKMDRLCLRKSWRENPALALAGALCLSLTNQKRSTWVWLPFSERLEGLAAWTCHLMAESLSKATDREGKATGMGPCQSRACVGDVYAQLQTFAEGIDLQMPIVLTRSRPEVDLRLPKESVSGRKGAPSLEAVFDAERCAFEHELVRRGKPCLAVRIRRVDPIHLGALVYLFQATVAYLGELLNIDIYGQAAAEEGKTLASSILDNGSPGRKKKSPLFHRRLLVGTGERVKAPLG
ncbi:MAG: glucose-6-phosphate isomerase [Candidatus Methylacidiphilales bacterium]